MKNFHSAVLINSLLLLYGFGSIQASEDQTFVTEEMHKKYYEQREQKEQRYRQAEKEAYKQYYERQEEASKKQREQEEAYKPYFKQQEEIYKNLLASEIPGVCPLEIDAVLAEELLTSCPQEVNALVSKIEKGACPRDQTNIMFHGMRQAGKTSLAQAVAIKTQTPCLFFNAGQISDTEKLLKIFEFAKSEKERLSKPCIVVIFDGLEALIKVEVAKDDDGSNALIKFWERLNNFRNSGVVFISTIDGTGSLPDQIIQKASMIEVPFPIQNTEKNFYLIGLK